MTAALSYRDFCFSYEQGAQVGPVVFEVAEGSFVLLTGATGCGKTTLLRCAKPELAPTGKREGVVRVFGADAASLDAATSASTVGYVAQSPQNQLVCSTVLHQMAFGLENLGMPQDAMRLRVAQVCQFFGMEPLLNKDVNELSVGQQQLVNLASVMVMQPRLLLLDEPCAQLDPVASRNFCHALMRLNRELGLTVVVATHEPRLFADYATSCVRLAAQGIASVSMETLREAAGQREQVREGAPRAQGEHVIEAFCLWYRYHREDAFVLRGMDLRVQRGGIHALVGGNGCGKSTLLRLLAQVAKPQRGKVANPFARGQALLPQDPQALFVCDSVDEELVEWQKACGYAQRGVDAMLERLGLDAQRCQHPYDLSGGQQQLLAFAKLMLTEPSLLLADEPTKGLDARAKSRFEELLAERVAQGMTAIVATHDLAFVARNADAVTLLFDGQDACTCTPREFFAGNLFFVPLADGELAS